MARDRSSYARKPPVPQFPTGLQYGKGVALQQQAASMPSAPARPGPTSPAPPSTPERFSLDAAMAQMSQMPQVTSLNAPTANPGEPLMAGVNAGAGPGSEVLPSFARKDRTQDVFDALAQATGDSAFSALAQLARGR